MARHEPLEIGRTIFRGDFSPRDDVRQPAAPATQSRASEPERARNDTVQVIQLRGAK
jgi:hypothetical protein